MKKFFVYALTVIFTLNLIGCSSDDDNDDPKGDETWKQISKTYQGTSSISAMNLNGSTVVYDNIDGRTVKVEASSATAAKMDLNNVLPDKNLISVDLALKEESGAYSFSGEKVEGATTIKVSGDIKDSKLSLNITRSISSPLTATWKLNMLEIEGSPIPHADVYLDASTGSPMTDAMLNGLGQAVAPMISGKVSAVNVFLKGDGSFDVNWVKLGETEPTGMPATIAALVKIHYVVLDNVLMMALDKSLVSMLEAFAPAMGEMGLDMEALLGLLVDMGGYYGIPIYYMQDGSDMVFYLNKEMIVKVMGAVGPLLTAQIPEAMQPVFQAVMQAIPGAEKVNFGLVFGK